MNSSNNYVLVFTSRSNVTYDYCVWINNKEIILKKNYNII